MGGIETKEHDEPSRLPPRVTIVVRGIGRGGGSIVSAWAIQALQGRAEVTILSWFRVDVDALNRTFGTRLDASRLRFVRPPRLVQRAVERIGGTTNLLRHNVLARICVARRKRGVDDVVVCFDNEFDVGFPVIQYVHYPWAYAPASSEYRRTRSGRIRADAYRWLCRRVASFSDAGIRRNFTLVNSDYVGGVTRDLYQTETRTLAPPVPGGFPDLSWAERRNAVVVVGRVAPVKNWEAAIAVVEGVRKRGHDLELRLVGMRENAEYERHLVELARTRPWFSLHLELSREELTHAVAACRYGLHCMEGEHFGVAVGEMVRAGCVTFVHRSGGQVEIVAHEPQLTFLTTDEAIDKISATLDDPERQEELRRRLEPQRLRFSEERFVREFLELLQEFSAGANSPSSENLFEAR